jgi:hypothetical protein
MLMVYMLTTSVLTTYMHTACILTAYVHTAYMHTKYIMHGVTVLDHLEQFTASS